MLVFQKEPENIDQFMNSLGTRYAMYFNKKYKRVGPLFQGVYKAVRVTSEEQLLYLTKYIHLNPDPERKKEIIQSYAYSSYPVYIGVDRRPWLDSTTILSDARLNSEKYKDFVEDHRNDEQMIILASKGLAF